MKLCRPHRVEGARYAVRAGRSFRAFHLANGAADGFAILADGVYAAWFTVPGMVTGTVVLGDTTAAVMVDQSHLSPDAPALSWLLC